MNGADPSRQRKRKRKTRAERNQISRHCMQESEKHDKTSTKGKRGIPSQSASYTLRSGRGAVMSTLGLPDCRKATTGTITQGRLTRNLGILSFTNAKSSDWIKRGPIPETETVKRKVENDMKRILNLAERSRLNDRGDFGVSCLSEKDSIAQETKETETDVMEVDPPPESSPLERKRTAQDIAGKEIAGSKMRSDMTANSSVSVPADITPQDSKHCDDVLSSNSSNNGDETLEREPPVQDIALQILKELKPKFDKMFHDRNIEQEIYSDLQKLFKQSLCHPDTAVVENSTTGTFLPHQVELLKLSTPVSGSASSSGSTLSACRPPMTVETGHPYSCFHRSNTTKIPESNTCLPLQDVATYVCSSDYNKDIFSTQKNTPLRFTQAYLLSDAQETEPIIRINVNLDESDDDDNDDILSAARYNAFLASARELEAEQQRLRHLNRFSRMSPLCFPPYRHGHDCPHLVPHSCSRAEEDGASRNSREVHSSDWRNVHSTRLLDFSEPSGIHPPYSAPYSYPLTAVNTRMNPTHSHLLRRRQAAPPVSDPCQGNSSGCLFYTFDAPKSSAFSQDSGWPGLQTFTSSTRPSTEQIHAAPVGPQLVQSRARFQTALNSACNLSSRNDAKTDPMDWDACDTFLSSMHGKGQSAQLCGPHTSKPFLTRPLSELQSHQADLQRQARTFLEDLNRTSVKRQATFEPAACTRHLLRLSSPDSSGSPVWMAPVLKDVSLEAAGFV